MSDEPKSKSATTGRADQDAAKRLEDWLASSQGVQSLLNAREASKAATEYVYTESNIDPTLLRKPMTL